VTRPDEPMPIPAVVSDIAAGRPVAAVWVNELGGVTFAIDGGLGASPNCGREYVKVVRPQWADHLVAEADRLRWAAAHVRVPDVLGTGAGWLHTAGLAGRSAVDPRWVRDPRTAARAIGSGLRMLHDGLPVDACPFGPPAWVTDSTDDDLVVYHGDACAPNTLIDDGGQCCGHVDLGDLGVANRWADLAIATLSLSWNYAGDWQDELLDAYGVGPDPDRIEHYRHMWNAGDISSH
jgi:kanamycin kinase